MKTPSSVVQESFARFLPKAKEIAALAAAPSEKPERISAAMSFEDPNLCAYCKKKMEPSTVNDIPVLVCWNDRNVVPIYTGDEE